MVALLVQRNFSSIPASRSKLTGQFLSKTSTLTLLNMRIRPKFLARLITPTLTATFAACLLAMPSVHAATVTWNGGAVPDGRWTTAGNWNGVAPGTNDLLVFTGGTQTATTNNFPVGTSFNNIAFNSGASAFTLNGNSIILSSPTDAGSGLIAGGSISAVSSNAQTIRLPILLESGSHTITNGGIGLLKLNGTITHSNGAVALFSTNINVAGALSINGAGLNGILGGWAVLKTNWTTLDANSNIIAYAGYTEMARNKTLTNDATKNVRITSSANQVTTGLPASTTAINSLLFATTATGTAGTETVIVGAGTNLVLGQNGGIFNTTSNLGIGAYRMLTIGASLAQGGVLTAGNGVDPAQITLNSSSLPNAASFLAVNSAIKDNGAAPVTVTLSGAYCNLNGTNTYSGGTYILQGRVSQPNENTFGTGPIYIVSGGQANPGRATTTGVNITNDFYIAGSGTVESGGMGALRMFGNAGVTIGAVTTGTKLTGKITLTDNATVCANGDVTDGIGISGKITGPGGFTLGSTTFNANNNNGAGGVFTIGDLTGAAIPNDYAGDTRINGGAGGANNNVGSTLKIFTAADNNIMPHGSTGSFAGGKTGNLILNATAANRACTFDLNGSTQTINGISSTATSPANNIITDSAGGGVLIIGDNSASSTFGGVIQNAIPVTKIGTGTISLTGANTYSGTTAVTAGTLRTTTASTGAGNYSVGNSATLGVSAASVGGTLGVNNLTFGTSTLQLNASTFGNPSAAIINVTGALTLNGTVTVSISGSSLTAGGPFTVLTYVPGSRSGSGSFTMVNTPRVVATLNDDTNAGIVSVTIISADSAIKWKGTAGGNWDINNTGNTIWQTVPSAASTYYIEGGTGNDVVLFDDSLTGTTNVNLTTALTPQGITVNNSAVNYAFTGSGRLTGGTGLTKSGSGTLTIANSGSNDFSGDILLNAGTLVVSNASPIGNTISGGGSIIKVGGDQLTLSGANTFTGTVSVTAGTLRVINSTALGDVTGGTTIANGATLDIGLNSASLDVEPITVSGFGVNSNGAIINGSGNAGFTVSNFKKVTMMGDTAIGGTGRLDFRTTDPTFGTEASLNTGGQPYKLTKLGANQLQLAGVQIDPALGDIEVQGGIFGLQGTIPSLGNANNTLTLFSNATLQLFALQSPISKTLVLRDGSTVNNANSANTFGGGVTLQGTDLFNIANGTTLTLTNIVGGSGTLSKIGGAGTLALDASNSYIGATLISAGTLSLTEPGDISSSSAFFVGSGATLDVNGRTDQTLKLLNGRSLSGAGTVNGTVIANAGSTVAPGDNAATIGTLTVNGNVTLSGTNVIKLVQTNLTSDMLLVNGTLTLGGTLRLVNLAGTFAGGESFQIFSAFGYNSGFTSIVPATPGPGQTWDTNSLATTGVISVVGSGVNNTPTNIVSSVAGGNLTLSWPGDHIGWTLQVQTNSRSAGLGANWFPVAGSSLTNQVTVPVDSTQPTVFYRLTYP